LQYGKGLHCEIDLCHPDAWPALQKLLNAYRPGQTPLQLQFKTASAEGRLRVPSNHSVRCEAGLIAQLRCLDGVTGVQVSLSRPWASANSTNAAMA
jgi:hypothetical protein